MNRVFGKNLENNQVNGSKQQKEITLNIDKENNVNDAIKHKGKLIRKINKSQHDPQRLDIYQSEIYSTLIMKDKIETNYNILELHINESMRFIVIKHIIEQCAKFNLMSKTIFMTIDIFDQCVGLANPKNFQEIDLMALTCLFISTKFEEIYPPPLWALLKDTQFQKSDVIEYENNILQLLQFDIISNNTLVWVELTLLQLNPNDKYYDQIRKISQFLAELSLINSMLVSYKRSQLAAAILLIVEMIIGPQKTQFQWSNIEITPQRNERAVKLLCVLMQNKQKTQFIRDKYVL